MPFFGVISGGAHSAFPFPTRCFPTWDFFFSFFHAPNAVLSAWQVWMHLMHFGVENNNNSNKTEGRLRSFDLSASFLVETLTARPGWAFPGASASRCGCCWEAPGTGRRSINQICAERPRNQEGFGTKGFAPGPCSPFKLHIETRCKILQHWAL